VPLCKKKTKKCLEKNFKELSKTNRPHKQVIAIALSVQKPKKKVKK